MAAATVSIVTPGRGPNPANDLTCFEVQVVATATPYVTATGGLPFDLTAALQTISGTLMQGGQAPYQITTVNPLDIVCSIPFQMSTNGFLPMNLTVGTATFTPVVWQADNGPNATPGALLTCPCTIRLYGSGAGSGLGFAEVANGNITDTFTILIYINRNGANA